MRRRLISSVATRLLIPEGRSDESYKFLPEDAKYVMQDRRGLWYYSTRKPRPKEGDWTPNKTSIACRNEQGYVRALRTDVELGWLDTCQRTVRMVSGNGAARRPADD